MQQYPTLINRPVTQYKNKIEIGFDQKPYDELFQ